MLYYDGQTGTHCPTFRLNAMRKSCSKLLNVSSKIVELVIVLLFRFVFFLVCVTNVSFWAVSYVFRSFVFVMDFRLILKSFVSWFLVKYTRLSYTILYIGMNLRNTFFFWNKCERLKAAFESFTKINGARVLWRFLSVAFYTYIESRAYIENESRIIL